MFDFSDETERATTAWLSAHPEVAKVREAARACVGIAIPASILKGSVLIAMIEQNFRDNQPRFEKMAAAFDYEFYRDGK